MHSCTRQHGGRRCNIRKNKGGTGYTGVVLYIWRALNTRRLGVFGVQDGNEAFQEELGVVVRK